MSLKRKFTKSLIEEMARHLASHKSDKPIDDERQNQKKLGDQLYLALYRDDQRKALKLAEPGWFPCTNTLEIKFVHPSDPEKDIELPIKQYNEEDSYARRTSAHHPNGGVTSVIGRSSVKVTMTDARSVPHCHHRSYIPISSTHPLVTKLIESLEREASLSEEKENFTEQMTNILYDAGNFFDLYKAWPEVKELLVSFEPKDASRPKKMELVLDVNSLNLALDIPTEKVMAEHA
jgi:hypothetical protein